MQGELAQIISSNQEETVSRTELTKLQQLRTWQLSPVEKLPG